MDSQITKKEVNCLALTFFFEYLKAHHIDKSVILEGFNLPIEFFENRTNWISYDAFLEIEQRVRTLFPDQPDLFFDIGRTFAATKSLGFTRVVVRAVLSPYQVYSRVPRLVKRFLFPFVDIVFTKAGRNRLIGTYTFTEGFPPSDAFVDTVRGILTGVPAIMGAPEANVTATRTSEYQVVFDISLGEKWVGLWPFIKRFFSQLIGTIKTQFRNARDALKELEETNKLLQEKVDALIVAEADLKKHVRELSTLNSLANVCASYLEIEQLLTHVSQLLYTELGNTPTAIFTLNENNNNQFWATTDINLPKEIEEFVKNKPFTSNEIFTETIRQTKYIFLPLMVHNKIIAFIVFAGLNESAYNANFLDSLRAQIAMATENALSYRTIIDLSQNLELRVKERTAELEDARGKLEDTVDRLKRSDQSRTDFFTNVSHELKTPLALILAPVDDLEAQMRKDGLTNGVSNLNLIRDNAQLLLRHINEILDFAKIDSGKIQIHVEQNDLNQFLADVVVSLQPLALKKRLQFSYEKPAEALKVVFDPKLIRRVFVNLLSNAIKYVEEEDEVKVKVTYDENNIYIEVSDTGPGIPPEYHASIFERFSRVPDSRGRTIEGTGVGLAMVKEIIQLHHGDISLKSQLGMGATFIVTLPRKQPMEVENIDESVPRTQEYSSNSLSDITPSLLVTPPSETIADQQTMQAVAPKEPTGLSQQTTYEHGTLLLVEDNPSMREFVTRLCSVRYNVISAPDGQQGLATAEKELPDIILSDVMMPVMNGYEMCRRLRANPVTRNIPVVLISARHGTQAAIEALEAGANDFVVKPFSAYELLARLDTQFKIRRLTLALIRAEKQSSLSTLAAGIGHEVLNPLNAVINGSAALRLILQRLGANSEIKELSAFDALINSIENAGKRIQKVVDSILAITRQSANSLQMNETHLNERIDAVMSVLSYRLGSKITVHRVNNFDDAVLCYPDLLHQVIMNLIVNALDAVQASGGQNIWITTDCVDGAARICVRDDGTGVPRHLRNRIFDAFFTTKDPGAGTGLGLAICREIAELHGGTIELNPKQEEGAEFIFSIPLSQSEAQETDKPAPNKILEAPSPQA